MIFMISYIPLIFPASWMLDKWVNWSCSSLVHILNQYSAHLTHIVFIPNDAMQFNLRLPPAASSVYFVIINSAHGSREALREWPTALMGTQITSAAPTRNNVDFLIMYIAQPHIALAPAPAIFYLYTRICSSNKPMRGPSKSIPPSNRALRASNIQFIPSQITLSVGLPPSSHILPQANTHSRCALECPYCQPPSHHAISHRS